MAKWRLTVENHPYVKDGDYSFDNLPKLEAYVWQNDIQCDHITELVRISRIEDTITSYTVSEIVPVSAVRLILEVKKSKHVIL